MANTVTDSVAVYSIAGDNALHPVQIQEFSLKGPKLPAGGTGAIQSNAFEIALDPAGTTLFAVSQSTNPAFPQGNQLHALTVARDGTLTEPTGPTILSADLVAG